MRVGIVGCGLIGGKRAAALGQAQAAATQGDVLTATLDRVPARAQALAARTPGAVACTSMDELLARVDAVVIATSNDQLTPMALAAVNAGKPTLIEKPAARSADELAPLVALAERRGVVVQVGFNHRFHPSARKARALLDSGVCGPLMFVRARYGHGGRLGYEKEWRADPAISGGGELIDQGVHLIDLSRWFLGEDLGHVQGHVGTFFWKMAVDDNAFLTLSTAKGQVAHLHASCTEWKNLFSFEIYGRDAKLHLEGLGGSYGVERLYHYQMRPEMGPPDTVIHEYPGADTSWADEWKDFSGATRGERGIGASAADALATLRIVAEAYRTCRS